MEILMDNEQRLAWLTMGIMDGLPPFIPMIQQHKKLLSLILGEELMAIRNSNHVLNKLAADDIALSLAKDVGMNVSDAPSDEHKSCDCGNCNPDELAGINIFSIRPEGLMPINPGSAPPLPPHIKDIMNQIMQGKGGKSTFNPNRIDPHKKPVSKTDRLKMK